MFVQVSTQDICHQWVHNSWLSISM